MQQIGVIGAGSFGTAIANLLAEANRVLLLARREEVILQIQDSGSHKGHNIHQNIELTSSYEEICEKCTLIYLMVDSSNFRGMMQTISPFLNPHHLLIHGTKGLNVVLPEGKNWENTHTFTRDNIRTMTEVITEESIVLRVGALSGPNLSRELAGEEPAATVIASHFDEIIRQGKDSLRSNRFRVYGSHDVLGVELGGVLKNIYAIASGMLNGLGLGENSKAMLISRGLGEMVHLGRALGAKTQAFFGVSGIGDLIATCSSTSSRNYTVGNRIAKGESLDFILEDMNEVAEGVKTTKIAKGLCDYYKIDAPIINSMYGILFENKPISRAIEQIMIHPNDIDADFIVNS